MVLFFGTFAICQTIGHVCRAWTVGVRLLYNINTGVLSPLMCCHLPLYDELVLTFTQKCLKYDNKLVNFVARHGIVVWLSTGSSIIQCCFRYNLVFDNIMSLSYWNTVICKDMDKTRSLLVAVWGVSSISDINVKKTAV